LEGKNSTPYLKNVMDLKLIDIRANNKNLKDAICDLKIDFSFTFGNTKMAEVVVTPTL
jgi:hypothetical protein